MSEATSQTPEAQPIVYSASFPSKRNSEFPPHQLCSTEVLMHKPSFEEVPGRGVVIGMRVVMTNRLRDITGQNKASISLSSRLEMDVEGVEASAVLGEKCRTRYGISSNVGTSVGAAQLVGGLTDFANGHPEIDLDQFAQTVDDIVAEHFDVWNNARPHPLMLQSTTVGSRLADEVRRDLESRNAISANFRRLFGVDAHPNE